MSGDELIGGRCLWGCQLIRSVYSVFARRELSRAGTTSVITQYMVIRGDQVRLIAAESKTRVVGHPSPSQTRNSRELYIV